MSLVNQGGITLLAAAVASAAMGQVERASLQSATIDDLKQAYLACDAQATSGRLSTSAIMGCSVVYEELKARAFGGDFEKFLVWSRTRATERTSVNE
jgi:hypothetical protein